MRGYLGGYSPVDIVGNREEVERGELKGLTVST